MISSSSLLVVDVGNTATSFALYKRPWASSSKPDLIRTMSTSEFAKPARWQRILSRFPDFSSAVVSSVVPNVDAALARGLKRVFGRQLHFVDYRTSHKISVKTRFPSEVGADRIVNARAAMALTKGAAIVLDFGTATTFDCVTARHEYIGGVIAPGPVISAEALYTRTAKLPLVMLKEPAEPLGRDTKSSIRAGLYHGYRGLVKEIVSQLKKKLGANTSVLATGGQAQWILKDLNVVDKHEPYLTLFGLKLMWQDKMEGK